MGIYLNHRQGDPSKTLPYPVVLHKVVLGEHYAKTHDHLLPQTQFWAKLEQRYAEHPKAFLANHCDRIDHLIVANHRAELRQLRSATPSSVEGGETPPETLLPVFTSLLPPTSGGAGSVITLPTVPGTVVPTDGGPSTGPGTGGGPAPLAAPEPATALLLALGLGSVVIARRFTRRGRRA